MRKTAHGKVNSDKRRRRSNEQREVPPRGVKRGSPKHQEFTSVGTGPGTCEGRKTKCRGYEKAQSAATQQPLEHGTVNTASKVERTSGRDTEI